MVARLSELLLSDAVKHTVLSTQPGELLHASRHEKFEEAVLELCLAIESVTKQSSNFRTKQVHPTRS